MAQVIMFRRVFAFMILATGLADAQEIVLDRRVAASIDDVEESASGSITRTSSDLELVYDGSNQVVGMRFLNVQVPQGATISTAWVQFAADESQSEPTSLVIAGELSPNAPAFVDATDNVSARPLTNLVVAWDPPPWTAGQNGAGQRTPDLRLVIEQIVGQSAWSSGNALVLIIGGTGHRTAESYEGSSSLAPLLHVEATTVVSQDCLYPPSFPPDFSGPTCTPARQAEKCACSECFTWDQAPDLAAIDEYEVFRRVVGMSSWNVVGHLYKSPAWADTDGTERPAWISTSWCVGRDSIGLPINGALYEYAVKACKTTNSVRQCSVAYSVPVLYRGTLYWDLVHP